MGGTIADAQAQRLAQLEKNYEELTKKFIAQQEERYGYAPQIAPIEDDEEDDIQDEVPADEERSVKSRPAQRMFTLAEVEELINRRIEAVKASLAPQQQDNPVFDGGEPIPHHVHLEDGRVITYHGGLGTHYSDENGVYRIVAAYPAPKSEGK